MYDQVQRAGYSKSEVETNAAALQLETSAADLKLEMGTTALELETDTVGLKSETKLDALDLGRRQTSLM
jgi:hypothetical protein